MPTGYTAFIEDGDITTGKEFLLLCLRNFGIAIDVRDEPLTVPTPTHFKPCVYAQNRYIAAIEHPQSAEKQTEVVLINQENTTTVNCVI